MPPCTVEHPDDHIGDSRIPFDVRSTSCNRCAGQAPFLQLRAHLVARPSGVTHFVETHELLLATENEYRDAFVRASLDVTHETGILVRGAWIGINRRTWMQ